VRKPRWTQRPLAAWSRYQSDGGDRLAAAITYFGFLSFFPLVALAFAILGYVVSGDSGVQREVEKGLASYLPGLIGHGPHQLSLDDIAASKASAGIIGLIGLLFTGLGWVDALRQSIKVIWHEPPRDKSFLRAKVNDLFLLVIVGGAVLTSVAVSAAATAVTDQLLSWVGLGGSFAAAAVTKALAVLVAVAVDTAVLTYLFTLVPRTPGGWRLVWRGALLGAVMLELLKVVGTFLIARTTSNPLYGTFAVVVGLLVWINLISRVLLWSASWTVLHLESLAPAEAMAVALPAEPVAAVEVVPVTGTADAERKGRDLGFAALGMLTAVTLGVARRGVSGLWHLARR
jgi:membrane protein